MSNLQQWFIGLHLNPMCHRRHAHEFPSHRPAQRRDVVFSVVATKALEQLPQLFPMLWNDQLFTGGAQRLSTILSFLQLLLERDLVLSTFKVYVVTISSCHKGFGDWSLFTHPLLKCFLRRVKRQCPLTRTLFPQWDLTLAMAPLQPLNQAFLKLLSGKMALLAQNTVGPKVKGAGACAGWRKAGFQGRSCPNLRLYTVWCTWTW